jgi:hypothetical protein
MPLHSDIVVDGKRFRVCDAHERFTFVACSFSRPVARRSTSSILLYRVVSGLDGGCAAWETAQLEIPFAVALEADPKGSAQ